MDGNTSIWKVTALHAAALVEATTAIGGAGTDGAQAEPSTTRTVADASADPSLECPGNTVRSEERGKESAGLGPITHICGRRCKDFFCEHCAAVQGPRLRAKLIDRVERWNHPMMLTFTVDRELLESPEAAYRWVAKKRAISRVMKEIRPYVKSREWFCVIEFQKDGGWPHWHVLLDSEFVPIAAVRAAWRRFVPRAKRHLIRPNIDSLGIVRYSKPDGFNNAKHAALYVSKYLTKFPETGFPDWVMEARYRIRRYGTSRGFWGVMTHRAQPEDDGSETIEKRRYSHRERAERCCTISTVYAVTESTDHETGEVKRQRRFMGNIVCHGRALASTMGELARKVPGLGLYVRSAFVSYLGSWREFVGNFGDAVRGSVFADRWQMSVRFIHEHQMESSE